MMQNLYAEEFKVFQKLIQFLHLELLMSIPLVILLEPRRGDDFSFHRSNDSINDSKELKSNSSSSAPERHSSMAASVSAFGLYSTLSKLSSIKRLTLTPCRRASAFRSANIYSGSLTVVCFLILLYTLVCCKGKHYFWKYKIIIGKYMCEIFMAATREMSAGGKPRELIQMIK